MDLKPWNFQGDLNYLLGSVEHLNGLGRER